LDIPNHFKINAPAGILLDGENVVSIRINSENSDIESHKTHYKGRLFNIEIEDDIFIETDIIKKLHGIRVKIRSSDKVFGIGKNLEIYRKTIPVFTAIPDSRLLKIINYLTALGFQVHIDMTTPPSDFKILEKTLEFYLYNPLLKTPIEPFHSLLKTLNRGGGYNLWDTEYERNGANIYIDDKSRVSLSSRWLNKGYSYGKLEDSWDTLSGSELYNKLSNFKEELFRKKSDCIFCDHLDICGGFLKAVDNTWPCESWIEIFNVLRNEAARAKNLLRENEKGRK